MANSDGLLHNCGATRIGNEVRFTHFIRVGLWCPLSSDYCRERPYYETGRH